jgi:hypothetical protein
VSNVDSESVERVIASALDRGRSLRRRRRIAGRSAGALFASAVIATAVAVLIAPHDVASRNLGRTSSTAVTSSDGRWVAVAPSPSGGVSWSVSCPTASFCVEVSSNCVGTPPLDGCAMTYSNGQWSPAELIDPHPVQLTVSCPTRSFCMAVDNVPGTSVPGQQGGYAATYSDGRWSQWQHVDPWNSLVDISCASPSFCVAIDYESGRAFVFVDGRWSHGQWIDKRGLLVAISCPSVTFCAAVDNDRTLESSSVFTYSHGDWSAGSKISTNLLDSVSCASELFCISLDSSGYAYAYDGRTWSTGREIGDVYQVSCATLSFCAAVGQGPRDTYATTYVAGKWSSVTAIPQLSPGGALSSVSCPSPSFCLAVGYGPGSNSVKYEP